MRQAVCGTNGGYLAHRRRGERACVPCREAHTEATWRWQHRNPDRYKQTYDRQNARRTNVKGAT